MPPTIRNVAPRLPLRLHDHNTEEESGGYIGSHFPSFDFALEADSFPWSWLGLDSTTRDVCGDGAVTPAKVAPLSTRSGDDAVAPVKAGPQDEPLGVLEWRSNCSSPKLELEGLPIGYPIFRGPDAEAVSDHIQPHVAPAVSEFASTSAPPRLVVATATNEAKMDTLVFEPGSIGIKVTVATGVVTSVFPGGQGERLGVKVGWRVHTLDDAAYSNERLRACTACKQRYSITFITTPAADKGEVKAPAADKGQVEAPGCRQR